MLGSIFEINLVCADAETTNNQQVLGFIQNLLVQLCLGADANNMNITRTLSAQCSIGLSNIMIMKEIKILYTGQIMPQEA